MGWHQYRRLLGPRLVSHPQRVPLTRGNRLEVAPRLCGPIPPFGSWLTECLPGRSGNSASISSIPLLELVRSSFEVIEEPCLASFEFKQTYDELWMLEKFDDRSSAQVRRERAGLDAGAEASLGWRWRTAT